MYVRVILCKGSVYFEITQENYLTFEKIMVDYVSKIKCPLSNPYKDKAMRPMACMP